MSNDLKDPEERTINNRTVNNRTVNNKRLAQDDIERESASKSNSIVVGIALIIALLIGLAFMFNREDAPLASSAAANGNMRPVAVAPVNTVPANAARSNTNANSGNANQSVNGGVSSAPATIDSNNSNSGTSTGVTTNNGTTTDSVTTTTTP